MTTKQQWSYTYIAAGTDRSTAPSMTSVKEDQGEPIPYGDFFPPNTPPLLQLLGMS